VKKLKCIVIFFLFCLAGALFILNGTALKVFSFFLDYPDYLIITADEYYDNAKLQEFISWKTSQGYHVQLEKISTILNNYPINNPDDSYFLKVQNFEDIHSGYIRVFALWKDGTRYKVNAMQGLGGFVSLHPPNTPQKVYLHIEGQGSRTIYFTYDGGQTLNITIPSYPYCYTYWGKPLVTIDGQVYFYKTNAYSIVEYLKAQTNIKYLLLIGNVSRVPSFEVKRITCSASDCVVYNSVTDYPYSALNFETTNKEMLPSFSVSRIPCSNTKQLETELNKIMNFKPYMSKKAIFIEGPSGFVPQDDWDEVYYELRNSINNSLLTTYPDIKTYELVEPNKQTFLSKFNSENSYAIFMAHGSTNTMWLDSSSGYSLTIWEIYDNVKFLNSTIITPHSCSVNDFSHFKEGIECIGEAFLFDIDSNVPVFIGSTLPTNYGFRILKYFYQYLPYQKTVGNTLDYVKSMSFTIANYLLIERLIWNVLGDASLNLIPEQQPPKEYGWLDLSFTVNGQTPSDSALFSVVFPNNTVKQYQGIRITINQCPTGTYQISCTYNNETKNQTVSVTVNQGTKVSFDFAIIPPTGSIHIYSNIEAYVTVSGPINDSRMVDSSGWHLTNIPVGTYYITAKCDDVVLSHTISLTENADISYTFQFETYTPTTSYVEMINEYLPFILVGLAVIIIWKW